MNQLVAEVNQMLSSDVSWFPHEYTTEFYMLKGLLGLLATLMVLYHMRLAWEHVVQHGTFGQQLRYFTLFGLAVLITGASSEQIKQGAEVNYRNLGALGLILLLIVAMIVSIHEDFIRKRKNR